MALRTIDNKAMAQKLKELRIASGKSVAEVSAATGIGSSALRNYECGLRVPKYQAMAALADCYDCSVDSLFFRQ